MVRYRIYLRDAEGRIMSHADADCASDREACVLAESLIEPGEQAEVWHGVRRVQLIGLSRWRGAWIGTSNFSGLASVKNAFGVGIGIVHTATNTI
jgi:hypothetical protein